MYLVDRPDGVGQPCTVAPGLGAGSLEPVAAVILGKAFIPEPASLVELMACRATNGPVRAGPERAVDELGEAVTTVRRAICKMLGNEFPAVIIGPGDIHIRALEERDIGLVPIPITVVPERLGLEQVLLAEDLSVCGDCAQGEECQGNQ